MKNISFIFFLLFFILGCSQRCPTPQIESHGYEQRKVLLTNVIRGEDRSGVDVTYGKTKKFSSSDSLNQNNQSFATDKFKTESLPNQKIASIYFDFNRYNIKNSMENSIYNNVKLLNKPKNIDLQVLLEGNCDELGSEKYNYSLGLRRANSVKSSLISLGINKDRIFVKSFGKTKPICNENTKSCHQKNRRVDLVLGKY